MKRVTLSRLSAISCATNWAPVISAARQVLIAAAGRSSAMASAGAALLLSEATVATPGRQRSTNLRHCPSDCGWAYSTLISDIATPGRVTRYWRMGITVSPAICSAVS